MDTATVLWIVGGVVVLLVVLGLVFLFVRKRREEHERAQRAENQQRAADMRMKAEEAELSARESEIQAAKAQAEADQALVDSERLRNEARQRQSDAGNLHRDSADQMKHAASIDPDVDTGTTEAWDPDEQGHVADARRRGDGPADQSMDDSPGSDGGSPADSRRQTGA